ncbi:A24 family peptidase [Anatilimnocola sp. NA78]|uniref:prepilin peptidase n=1 Tax=Anatilimnocola sp. NA78 TaxID=3415683 RepID=UPI003CE5C820
MDVALLISPLAQVTRRIVIEEPRVSAETIWWIGAALLGTWMFAVGGSVGSFLNVVVYRLPAGLNLISPGSRCPRCLSPIRSRHNIPILGWLLLRGRCADCHLPISSRYPLVETWVACLFLLVGCVEILGHGMNLPVPPAGSWRAPLNTFEPWPLGIAVMLHLFLLTTLVAAILIDYDAHRIPRRLFLPVLLFAIVAPLVWPAVHPVPAINWQGWQLPITPSNRWLLGLVDIAAGAIAGLLASAAFYLTTRSRPQLVQRYFGPVSLMWISVGLVFGWQFIPLVLCAWSISLLVNGQKADGSLRWIPPAAPLFGWLLLALLTWRWWQPYFRTIEPHTTTSVLSMLGIVALSCVTLLVVTLKLPLELVWDKPSPAPVDELPAEEPTAEPPPADEALLPTSTAEPPLPSPSDEPS